MRDHIFEVGLPISIETYYKYYLTTHLIGWEPDAFLVTGIVQSSGKTGQLKAGERCMMRFLKEGVAYGFETKILAINFNPFPVMFSKYPKVIEQFTVRKFSRVKVNLPAQLLDGDGRFVAETTITDISAGGCGLTMPTQAGREFPSETSYRIRFTAMNHTMWLCCSIRKMKTFQDTQVLGVEFVNVLPEEREKIEQFLDICQSVFTSKTDLILSQLKKEEKIMGGHLNEVSLVDMLQIFEQLQKNGTIHVVSGRQKGSVSIEDGFVTEALLEDRRGEDALIDLLSFQEGEFYVSAKKASAGSMRSPINFVLMDISRLMDERAAFNEYLPAKEDKFVLHKNPDSDSDDLELMSVLGALREGASTTAGIHETAGLSLIRARLALAKLLKDGYLTKTF